VNRGQFLVELLKDRPHASGAEIGVKKADASAFLLAKLPGLRILYCVDPWEYYPGMELGCTKHGRWPNPEMSEGDYLAALRRLAPFGDRARILRLKSSEAAPLVPDASLDFVFIDANHAYEFVREDIALWTPKVRPGGIVSGHDYSFRAEIWGVRRAADEAFPGRIRTGPDDVWWVELSTTPDSTIQEGRAR
jgi:hypothetical protein